MPPALTSSIIDADEEEKPLEGNEDEKFESSEDPTQNEKEEADNQASTDYQHQN